MKLTADSSHRTSYLSRVLELAEIVAAGPDEGLTLSELSTRAGAPISTVLRLVRLLEERRFARRLPDKRIVPGPALVMLGLRSLRRLPAERFHVAVQTLVELTGESVSVGLVVGAEITLIDRRESTHPLRYVASVGDVIPPHRSAMGQAILAYLPAERRRELVRSAVGDEADAVLAALAPELEAVARAGIGRDEEAFAVGLRCIAAPVLGADGQAVGAISISGPAARFTRELADAFAPALLEQTRQLCETPAALVA